MLVRHQKIRAIAYGGGVQSTALLVLAAEQVIDFNTMLFCDVGHDSENPSTITYIEQVAKPYAADHGIAFHELRWTRRNGKSTTLYEQLTDDNTRSIPIPVRMRNGAPGTRQCTAYYKITPISQWLKAHGATQNNPAILGIGISLDEIHRANNRKSKPNEQIVYPLLDHTPALRRIDCQQIITRAGLPLPSKSSCWFCPYHRLSEWSEMRRDNPDQFRRACQLEDTLNRRRERLGKDHVFFTGRGVPLANAAGEAQDQLPIDSYSGMCDEGVCFV